uniref:Cilia- and flagella-associated protein 251 n=1 Tax=Chromera velia CCMP2878 TaxID=1169474 RepID=A0A0G4H590_9ALVE|eukprot:Cvel_24734.t1-p1 / transcript=Cvel_24734.t1 / gene=Cvel_24734 / organism=Chromera_velia_CCMP2878 / gene_product=WD repeat-containing protein 66, putative / transcript_product=WD repeat-containing protein 66, putative / location=Cvel_scaffold2716:6875-18394(+) / protein_length=1031 / sequence_SO=supercontig / SO=protein_coding / is_pseudo=false
MQALTEMLYAAAHTGVIFDYNTGHQRLLQGHVNAITALGCSVDKKWLITADAGQDSMLVVWERATASPVKTIFDPHPFGVIALDITPSSQHIVTLSAPIPASHARGKGPTGSRRTGGSGSQGHSQSQNTQGSGAEGEGEEGGDGFEDSLEEEGKKLSTRNKNKQNGECQSVSVWDWTAPDAVPVCTALIGTQDIQTCVLFNAWDSNELATNGRRRVFFWTFRQNRPFEFYSPALSAQDFKQAVADFTQTVFLPDSTQAATGTARGDVVIWDLSLIVDGMSRPDERRAVKIIQLCPDTALSVMRVFSKFVIIGGSDGAVRFFDFQFRIQAWFEDLHAGAVRAVSFEYSEEDEDEAAVAHAGGAEEDFACPSFLVFTASALVVLVESSLFYKLMPDDRRGRTVLQGLDAPVFALSCHPRQALVAVGGYSGFVHLWNYRARALHSARAFDRLQPHCLAFSPCGRMLAVGFTSGHFYLLHADDLSDLYPPRGVASDEFCFSNNPVALIAWAPDSSHVAVAHNGNDKCVCLYRGPSRSDKHGRRGQGHGQTEWRFAGKHRSHWRPIVGLSFSTLPAGQGKGGTSHGERENGGEKEKEKEKLRLVSVGEDRRLVEYDLREKERDSRETSGLRTCGSTIIEQEARPSGCLWFPRGSRGPDQASVLVMNDEYKLKIWNVPHKKCRKTVIAPTYGGPVCRMLPVPGEAERDRKGRGGEEKDEKEKEAHSGKSADDEGVLLYSCWQKVLGLVLKPLDGNPSKSMALIAHPGTVAAMAVDCTGKYAFTCGGEDCTVNQWAIDTTPLKAAAAMAGEGLDPFLSLIPGGAEGSFFSEMKDFFYYAQIRSQDENTTAARELDEQIPLEVRYSSFAETGQQKRRVNFEDTFKLFVNHRPVFAVTPEQISLAFKALSGHDRGTSIPREKFVGFLKELGERFTNDSNHEMTLEQCMELLVGEPNLEAALGDVVGADTFALDVLGLGESTEATERDGLQGGQSEALEVAGDEIEKRETGAGGETNAAGALVEAAASSRSPAQPLSSLVR